MRMRIVLLLLGRLGVFFENFSERFTIEDCGIVHFVDKFSFAGEVHASHGGLATDVVSFI